MRYEQIEPITVAAAQALLNGDDEMAAARAVIAIGLHSEEFDPAIGFLLNAAQSDNEIVLGSALLSFGHMARRFGNLPEQAVRPLIERGLRHADALVRRQAHAATDDLEHFLGWSFRHRSDA
jgi:HEAT repeat protein